jgi:multidrug resistance efflux pump
VQSLDVVEGQAVESGQILASLDAVETQLAVEQARSALEAAQANYQQLKATLPASRQAEISAAALALAEAQNALDRLQQDAPLGAAEAQLAVSNAQKALAEAQRKRTNMDYPRANQTTIDGAQAFYDLKELELEKARGDYDRVKGHSADDPERIKALLDLTNAQNERDRALITLNWYLGKNSEQDLAQADAELALARAKLEAAQRRWDELRLGPAPAELALAEARLASAQAQAALANARLAEADLSQAQSQVDAARLSLEAAEAQLAKMKIIAPFAGVVATLAIEPGEWAMAGQPILTLVDLEHLYVETTDLSERDLPQVAPGQAVTVFVKALGQEISGQVSRISPLAETLGGDVVYRTTIDLEEALPGLRVGMSVEVQFGGGP